VAKISAKSNTPDSSLPERLLPLNYAEHHLPPTPPKIIPKYQGQSLSSKDSPMLYRGVERLVDDAAARKLTKRKERN
jgi:hypothetical protein